MKKIIALLLAVAMLATLGLSAFAADITGDGETTNGSGSADVYTELGDEWWVVQIPADKQIAWGETSSSEMGYKVASQLAEGSQISVTVTAGSTTLNQDNGSETIAYTGTGLTTPATYNAVNGTGTDAETVTAWNDQTAAVKIDVDASAFAGKPIDVYRVTLTYTVEVTEAD